MVYTQAIDALKEGLFSKAKTLFESCGKYKFAPDLVKVCDGEAQLAAGEFEDAWTSCYSKVSAKAKVSGFDVQGRRTYCAAKYNLEKVSGDWTAKSNNVYVWNITKYSFGRYKRKYYLTNLAPNQYVTVEYTDNGNNTFNINISVSFVRYTTPALGGASYLTLTKTLTNQKSFPTSIKLNGNTTLKYKNGAFTISFSRNTKSGRVKNQYRSTVSFRKA